MHLGTRWYSITEGVGIAVDALRANKVRAGLTILGIVAKDIAVLEHRRFGLVGRLFGRRIGGLVGFHDGLLLG